MNERHTTLKRMDLALALVDGSFVAAAKLLDMEPGQFRNRVNYHACLKSKWGRKRRGHPGNPLGFPITPFDLGAAKTLRRLPHVLKGAILSLPEAKQQELADWLESKLQAAGTQKERSAARNLFPS